MKKILLMIALVAVLASGCGLGDSANQSIAVRSTDDAYNFKATFAKRKSKRVAEYIESALKDDRIFEKGYEKNAELLLGDGSRFYLKASPGFVEIDFKKSKNSFTSYQKLKDLCAGIKDVLN